MANIYWAAKAPFPPPHKTPRVHKLEYNPPVSAGVSSHGLGIVSAPPWATPLSAGNPEKVLNVNAIMHC